MTPGWTRERQNTEIPQEETQVSPNRNPSAAQPSKTQAGRISGEGEMRRRSRNEPCLTATALPGPRLFSRPRTRGLSLAPEGKSSHVLLKRCTFNPGPRRATDSFVRGQQGAEKAGRDPRTFQGTQGHKHQWDNRELATRVCRMPRNLRAGPRGRRVPRPKIPELDGSSKTTILDRRAGDSVPRP